MSDLQGAYVEGDYDRVVRQAETADVPVLVYATPAGFRGRLEDMLFPVYRYVRQRWRGVSGPADRRQ